MRPRQDDVRGHRSDDVRVVSNAGSAGVAGPAVGFLGGAGFNIGFDEGVQARGGEVGDRRQPHPTGPAVVHFDGAGDQHLAIGAAPLPAGRRIGLGAMRDHGLVDLHQARQRRAVGRHHGLAQLGAQQPGRLLQLQGGDTVGVRGHQIRRPEPDGQRQLRAVHHRARSYRGLLAAASAFPGEGLGRKLPALVVATVRAAEPSGPARVSQIRRTRALIREAVLKLDERARKVDHGGPSKQGVRYMFYPDQLAPSPHFGAAGASGISLYSYLALTSMVIAKDDILKINSLIESITLLRNYGLPYLKISAKLTEHS